MIDPVLVHSGPLKLHWYGLMVAMGMLGGYLLAQLRRKIYDFQKSDDISDITFYAMIGGILGARILYVIRFWDQQFAMDPAAVFRIWEGGLVFLGGFTGAVLMVLLLCWRRKWVVWKVADLLAPSLLLGQTFGRLGCLLNGCCHGFAYDGPMALSYLTHPAPTFPLQAFSALAALLGCLLLLWVEHKKKWQKKLFLLYLLLYSTGRFLLEFGRGDYPATQRVFQLTPAQITCLWLLPLSLFLYLFSGWMRKHVRK